MQFEINYNDPSFYSEIEFVERNLEGSFAAYTFVLDRFKQVGEESESVNIGIPELLFYQTVVFDKLKLTAHSLVYFEECGQLAQKLTDILSRVRYKFDLFEDQEFNESFECVCQFLELLTQSYSKLKALRRVYEDDLIHLSN